MGSLSAKQKAKLKDCRNRWAEARLATGPANRAAAEQAVVEAYRAASLDPPRKIIWGESPVAMEHSRKRHWRALNPGPNVKRKLVDDLLGGAHMAVQRRLHYSNYLDIARQLNLPPRPETWTLELNQAISSATASIHWELVVHLRAARQRITGGESFFYTTYEQSRWAQHESMEKLALHQFLHDAMGMKAETQSLAGLWGLALNAGWIVPHERVCWLSERPTILSIDAQGRLHAPTGPAVRYGDGWSHYSWKGVAVPAWLIEEPGRITPRSVEWEANLVLRRCMIEIMGVERYVASGIPRKVASDQSGILWRKEWSDGQIWSAVEVINGTPEPNGALKHYFLQVPHDLRTPREAVAWTYGLTADRYSDLIRRT